MNDFLFFFGVTIIYLQSYDTRWHSKDFREHARLCDKLLAHYTCQYRDRQIYYAARNRSACEKDLLCIIVDSFDKAKLSLPKYPYARTPKRTIYENTLRTLGDQSWQDNFVKKKNV